MINNTQILNDSTQSILDELNRKNVCDKSKLPSKHQLTKSKSLIAGRKNSSTKENLKNQGKQTHTAVYSSFFSQNKLKLNTNSNNLLEKKNIEAQEISLQLLKKARSQTPPPIQRIHIQRRIMQKHQHNDEDQTQFRSPSQVQLKTNCQQLAADTPDDIKEERLVGSLLSDESEQHMSKAQSQVFRCRNHPINQLRKEVIPGTQKKQLTKAISLVLNQAKRKQVLKILQSQGIPRKLAILKVEAFSLSGKKMEKELDIEDVRQTFQDFANVKSAKNIKGVGIFMFNDIVEAFFVQTAFDNHVNTEQDFRLSVKWYELQDDENLFHDVTNQPTSSVSNEISLESSFQQLSLSSSVPQLTKISSQQIRSNNQCEKSQCEELISEKLNISQQFCNQTSRPCSQCSLEQNSATSSQKSIRKELPLEEDCKKNVGVSSSSSSSEQYKSFPIHSNQNRNNFNFKKSKSVINPTVQKQGEGISFQPPQLNQIEQNQFSQQQQHQKQSLSAQSFGNEFENDSGTGDYSMGGNHNGGVSSKYTGRFEIQIDNDKEFQVARRLIGSKGSNMKRIIEACKKGFFPHNDCSNDVVKLRLRGKGSGFKQGPMKKESDQPLHLCISSKYSDKYKIASKLVEDLLVKIYSDYRNYCYEKGRKIVNLYIKKIENAANPNRKSNSSNCLQSNNIPNQYNFPSRQRNKQPFGYDDYQQQNLGPQYQNHGHQHQYQHANSFDYPGKMSSYSHSNIGPSSHSFTGNMNTDQSNNGSNNYHHILPYPSYSDTGAIFQMQHPPNPGYAQSKNEQIYNYPPPPPPSSSSPNMPIIQSPGNFASVYASTQPGAPLIRHYLVPENYPFMNMQQGQQQIWPQQFNNQQQQQEQIYENDLSKFQTILSPNAGTFIPQNNINYNSSQMNNNSSKKNSHSNQTQQQQQINQ